MWWKIWPPENKFQTIDEYIATFPEDIQDIFEKMRKIVQEAVPESEEVINYGVPTFKRHGNLVHFSAYKNHIGFYPTPSGIEALKKDISEYKSSKGTVSSLWMNRSLMTWWRRLLFFE